MTPETTTAPNTSSLRGRHLLGIADLTKDEIVLVLDTAAAASSPRRRRSPDASTSSRLATASAVATI